MHIRINVFSPQNRTVRGQRLSDKVASSTFQKHHVTDSCTVLPGPVFADLARCRPEGCISRRFIAKSNCYSNADVALYRSNLL